MINIDNITFSYRRGVPALIDANAEIGRGIHLLLGPNGSGKTTLMRVIAGMLLPQQGACLIDQKNVSQRKPSMLQRTFFIPDDPQFPFDTITDMTIRHAPFYPSFSLAHLHDNLRAFGMTGEEKLSHMSLGNRKKASIAYALALGAEVLLLDEPANGMDISSKEKLNQLLMANLQPDQTIIVATHTVHEMKNLFDGITIMDNGHISLSVTVDDVLSTLSFVVSPTAEPRAIYEEQNLQGYKSIVPNGTGIAQTQIDYVLLYNAIVNGKGEEIKHEIYNCYECLN